ncbi:MAG: hypothetical protein AUJ50_03885 [Candidatus Aenigmarchaeota archaeon CG1_02_38_14]|nr:hypothetical protein [Candidatus Aenigmarchaeota archaeon]OIN86331.1 MAG: hypothetical protein AUJ50_03885 [Candidatus Aenigmarchaeota archaeon CG1_02_38_14]
MRKTIRFFVVMILSGLVFGLAATNCLNLSIDDIIGSIYDHASPEAKESSVQNMRQACDDLKVISERPDIIVEINPRINMEELKKTCQKELDDRRLFVETIKSQTGGIESIISENPGLARYSILLKPNLKVTIASVGLIVLFLIILFIVEDTYITLFKTVGNIFLTTSLILFLIYFFPKTIEHLTNVDTSFLLELDQAGDRIIGLRETLLVLLPIILDSVFTDSLVIYAGAMFALWLAIFALLHAKSNKLITVNNNNTEDPAGP